MRCIYTHTLESVWNWRQYVPYVADAGFIVRKCFKYEQKRNSYLDSDWLLKNVFWIKISMYMAAFLDNDILLYEVQIFHILQYVYHFTLPAFLHLQSFLLTTRIGDQSKAIVFVWWKKKKSVGAGLISRYKTVVRRFGGKIKATREQVYLQSPKAVEGFIAMPTCSLMMTPITSITDSLFSNNTSKV